MKVIIAGGGTAGHINPAISIAEEILKNDSNSKILFVGNENSMEKTAALQCGFHFKCIKVSGFQRSFSLKNIKRNVNSIKYLLTAKNKCKKILNEFKPDLVIGTGGYVSGPILYTASKMGYKTIIHEQNAFPGVTTKILSKYVDTIMLSTEKAKKFIKYKDKCVVTGLPIRNAITNTSVQFAKRKYGEDNCITILSFGGSLGARPLNNAILKLMRWEQVNKKNIVHIHATGKKSYEEFIKSLKDLDVDIKDQRLIIRPYIDDMDICMKASDLVISRSGANTLSEITACKKASILIPSPYVSENHQYHNAKVLSDNDAAILIQEKDLTDMALINAVQYLLHNKDKLTEFSYNSGKLAILDSNEKIYKIIEKAVKF